MRNPKPKYSPATKPKSLGPLEGMKKGTMPQRGLLPKLGNLLKPTGSTKGKLK